MKNENLLKEEEFEKYLETRKLELEDAANKNCIRIVKNAEKKGDELIEAACEEAKKEATKIKNMTKEDMGKLEIGDDRIKEIISMLYGELEL